MATVCHVPLHYIFFRGQGIKSLSLVSKTCRKEGFLIPVMKKDQNDESIEVVGYEGATVFEPEIGFHRKPIAVKDYNSLYPSSIISKNVSHETIVTSPEYDNLPGYIYYDVAYNNQNGSQTYCRYAKKIDEFLDSNPNKSKFGIIPSILAFLLNERKATKKEMQKESDPFKKNILDGKQNALKVTNLPAPTEGGDAANKTYVDNADALKLDLAGGTMSGNIDMANSSISNVTNLSVNDLSNNDGNITFSSNLSAAGGKIINLPAPTDGADATNKDYVDTNTNDKLPLAGGTMSGSISMAGSPITNLPEPTQGDYATNKDYVDTAASTAQANAEATASADATAKADAAQAKSLLGWEPKHSNINTIIDSAYRWYTK
jgi:DNA polymerase elongation subunit (family B)